MVRTNLLLKIILGVLLAVTSGCSKDQDKATESPAPIATNSPVATITPTLPPLAARVNDGYILLSDYEAELRRLQATVEEQGAALSIDDQKNMVIDELIFQTLLVEGAQLDGYQVSDPELETRMDELASAIGGVDKLQAWMVENGYDETELRSQLRASMMAAWKRDRILEMVPTAVEQVHALEILVSNEGEAIIVQKKLQDGADFQALAKEYDPLTGGDLGWFPRDALFQSEVENAAFSLQSGEFSVIISTEIGYHIIKVLERDTERELTAAMLLDSQQRAIKDWLQNRREESNIEILVP